MWKKLVVVWTIIMILSFIVYRNKKGEKNMIYLVNSSEITPNWDCARYTCGGYDCRILNCGRYDEKEPCKFSVTCPSVNVPISSGALF